MKNRLLQKAFLLAAIIPACASAQAPALQNMSPQTQNTPKMEKETIRYCQSCGMPLTKPENLGTEADGTANDEYCTYCYRAGHFTWDCTMEEMIEQCAQFHDQFKDESGRSFTREEAVAAMRAYFPMLKRWQR